MVIEGNLHNGLGIVRGDSFSIRRTVNRIPPSRTITKAWLTLKSSISAADGSAEIQKSITGTYVGGSGVIENNGADGSGVIRFDLSSLNTAALTAGTVYYYDIQIKFDNDDIITIEKGETSAVEEVTKSTT